MKRIAKTSDRLGSRSAEAHAERMRKCFSGVTISRRSLDIVLI